MGFNEQQLSIFESNLEHGKQRTAAKKETNNNRVESSRTGERPELQKQPNPDSASDQRRGRLSGVRKKADVATNEHSKKRVSNMDERMRYRFRCTIVVAISGNRERDIDGAALTLFDCVRDAGRKFVEIYPEYAAWTKEHYPSNDTFFDIPILNVVAAIVPKGNEGATVYLERLTETEIAAWRQKCEIGDFFEPL